MVHLKDVNTNFKLIITVIYIFNWYIFKVIITKHCATQGHTTQQGPYLTELKGELQYF